MKRVLILLFLFIFFLNNEITAQIILKQSNKIQPIDKKRINNQKNISLNKSKKLIKVQPVSVRTIDKSQIQSPKKIKHKKPVKGLKYHNKNSKAVKKENE
jgi:hypothetical protein